MESAAHGRFFSLRTLSGLVGLAGIITLLLISLANERQVVEKNARQTVENLSLVLQEQALASVQKIDLLLRDIQGHVRPGDMRLQRGTGGARAMELHELLKSRIETTPDVSVVHLTNAKGEHIISSLTPLPLINIADRDYFQYQKSNAAAGLVISPPLISRTIGKWSLVLTRRLNFEDGSFAGVVTCIMNLDYLQQFYGSLHLGTQGAVAMYDTKMRLVARFPRSEKDMGKTPAGHAALPLVEKGITHAVYHTKAAIDGVDRLYSFRQVGKLPLFVFAGIARDDYLAEWRKHVWQYGVGALIFSMIVMGFLLRQRQVDETLRKNEADLRVAATAFESQQGMIITDVRCIILQVNHAFVNITGYTAEETVGQTPRLLKSERNPPDFFTAMWENINRTGLWQGEIWNRRKNGDVYPAWLTITAVKGTNDEVTNYVGTLNDITERKAVEEKINNLAFYDPLTHLPNRRLLMDRLRQALTSRNRSRHPGALLFIDLDNFKSLNDTKGHDIGDLLLIEVANRLKNRVRERDTVARLGGDEFVVILEDLGAEAERNSARAELVAQKILETISLPYHLQNHEYRTTCSIGIGLLNDHETSVDELLKRADAAMYQAKQSGRNTLQFFDPTMQAALEVRMTLESDLRHALLQNQYQLYYQAQVDHTGRVIGAEALLRWIHPQHGLVSPKQFIPLAEETGLIIPIGQWVLEVACQQIKAWETSPRTRSLRLAVNVSARQFRQPDFVEQVREIIKKAAIDPSLLKLELTESMVLGDVTDTIAKMQALKQIGVHFSMDDFGSGYSSLAYLTRLPLDQLKIDQSFVHNIGTKSTDVVIIQTIVGMANNLGIEVIAEGVETQLQRDFLEGAGCRYYQGYLFGRPVPLEEFTASLLAQSEIISSF